MGRKGYPRRKDIRKSDLKPFFDIFKFGSSMAKETGKELSRYNPPTKKPRNKNTSSDYGCAIAIICVVIIVFIGAVVLFDSFFFPFIILIGLIGSFFRGFK